MVWILCDRQKTVLRLPATVYCAAKRRWYTRWASVDAAYDAVPRIVPLMIFYHSLLKIVKGKSAKTLDNFKQVFYNVVIKTEYGSDDVRARCDVAWNLK